MTLGCVIGWARRVFRPLPGLEGPTQFPGWPDFLHFTNMNCLLQTQRALKLEVAKMEDSRQPQLTTFEV